MRETTTKSLSGPWIVLFDTGTFAVYDTKEDADAGLAHGIRETAGNVSGAVLPLGLMRAAPDLLAALEHAVEILRYGCFVRLEDPRVAEAVSSALWAARAALARATGGAR